MGSQLCRVESIQESFLIFLAEITRHYVMYPSMYCSYLPNFLPGTAGGLPRFSIVSTATDFGLPSELCLSVCVFAVEKLSPGKYTIYCILLNKVIIRRAIGYWKPPFERAEVIGEKDNILPFS